MPDKHALLGASSAHRWLHCPPSARLCEQFPDTQSDYAAAGTLAHSIAELKARKYFLEPMSARTFNIRLKKLKESPYYDKGMDAATDMYLEHLKTLALSFSSPPFVVLENRVDYSHLVPDGFGTADCIMIGEGRICVVDYKNGSGVPVEADNNPQMMLYGLGALHTYSTVYGDSIRNVHLSIVQPNAGGVKGWDTEVTVLEDWGTQYVAPLAKLAWEGKGGFAAGDWCRFCRAKAQCGARARKMLELEPLKGAEPENAPKTEGARLLTDSEIGDILTRAKDLQDWVKSLQDYALSAALEGREIKGWKAVEGRGSRDWTGGTDQAFKLLTERGIDNALLWERKPVTVAGLEKAIGKKLFAETTTDLVQKTPGKPTLVPASDNRPPYNPAAVAFKAVDA